MVPSQSTDRTPGTIRVWVCPQCGYFRHDKSTGFHVDFQDNGPGRRHKLIEAQYIYEGNVKR